MELNLYPFGAEVMKTLRPYLSIQSIAYLEGGLTNRCLKITDIANQHYVWRPKDQVVRQFGLNRQFEYQAIQIASKAGLTEPPVLNHQTGLLTRWVEGQQCHSLQLEQLTALLVKIHKLPRFVNAIDPYQKGQYYFSQLKKYQNHPLIYKVHHHFQNHRIVSQQSPVSIHCDLGAYNVIQHAEKGLQVIDWEYAGCGDPTLDLLFTAQANHIDLELLVDSYCAAQEIKDQSKWRDQSKAWLPVSQYLAGMWFVLGFELYENPFYWEQGKKLLESA